MSAAGLDPAACAMFLIAAFMLAGVCQASWLAWSASRRLAWPLDAGLTVRGRRVFGANKTVRGVIVMVPATGAAFMTTAAVAPWETFDLWPLSIAGYGALGVLAGAGFMAGELPNSFLKRQLAIAPGAPACGPIARPLFFLIDRMDSALGMLAALAIAVPVPIATVVAVLAVGPAIHGVFSLLTFRLGGKARAA
jgi:hypothetical protein